MKIPEYPVYSSIQAQIRSLQYQHNHMLPSILFILVLTTGVFLFKRRITTTLHQLTSSIINGKQGQGMVLIVGMMGCMILGSNASYNLPSTLLLYLEQWFTGGVSEDMSASNASSNSTVSNSHKKALFYWQHQFMYSAYAWPNIVLPVYSASVIHG